MPDKEHWAETHRGALILFARGLIAEHSRLHIDPDDIVQSTLMGAAKQPAPTTASVGQLAWLKAALRNTVIDEVRKLTAAKRDRHRERALGQLEPAAKQESPSRPARKAEEIARLMAHLDTLPAEQAEALRLRYLDGLAVDAVAVRMKRSRAAVAGLIRRGLKSLRDQYGESRVSL
jgi:RNA polymerase sigma-70 factor, ECF subfamily